MCQLRSPWALAPTRVQNPSPQPLSRIPQAPIVATIQVDINELLLEQNRERISRWQRSLITVGSGHSSPGSTTSSSTQSPTTSPPPRAASPASGSPLWRSARLAEEEEEYVAVNGPWRVDVEDVELERASSRRKKRTLAQGQAEEVPVPAPAEDD